ncbi:MAG: thioredoxin family protein [Chryseobacterium sp.]
MKKTSLKYFVALFMAFGSMAYAQTEKVKEDPKVIEQKKKAAAEEKAKLPKPYNPKADAQKDIDALIVQGKKENKNIMIQAGGNWCIRCLRFNQFVQTTPELKEIVDKNFVYYHLNYSPDNKNEVVFPNV